MYRSKGEPYGEILTLIAGGLKGIGAAAPLTLPASPLITRGHAHDITAFFLTFQRNEFVALRILQQLAE